MPDRASAAGDVTQGPFPSLPILKFALIRRKFLVQGHLWENAQEAERPSVWSSERGGGQAAGGPSRAVGAEKVSKFRLNEARCLNGERNHLSMQEMQEMRVQFPGLEYSLEKEMALQYSCLGNPVDRGV